MSADISEIVPHREGGGLYLCGTRPLKRPARDVEHRESIGAVVACMPRPPKQRMPIVCALPDRCHLIVALNKDKPWPPEDACVPLGDALRFIDEHRAAGRGVVVHCSAGKHRSATVVCAYLVHAGLAADMDGAVAHVRSRRGLVRPDDQARPLWDSIDLGAGDVTRDSPRPNKRARAGGRARVA